MSTTECKRNNSRHMWTQLFHKTFHSFACRFFTDFHCSIISSLFDSFFPFRICKQKSKKKRNCKSREILPCDRKLHVCALGNFAQAFCISLVFQYDFFFVRSRLVFITNNSHGKCVPFSIIFYILFFSVLSAPPSTRLQFKQETKKCEE